MQNSDGVVSTTIGMAGDPSGKLPIDELYQRADTALYFAKQHRKGQVMGWRADMQKRG